MNYIPKSTIAAASKWKWQKKRLPHEFDCEFVAQRPSLRAELARYNRTAFRCFVAAAILIGAGVLALFVL